MSNVSQTVAAQTAYANSNVNQTTDSSKTAQTKKKSVGGKTIGNPELSDKAAKYYESLKNKFSNMDIILVSKDQKEQAKSRAASYANPNKMVVLIDEEKIEKMAEDENYRKKYENIIANSSSGMAEFAKKITATGANVQGFGMQVNDNGATSFFAVMKKSGDQAVASQKARIEKSAAKKKAAKKAEEKKAEKKAEKERLQKSKSETDKIHGNSKNSKEINDDDETVTITASSMDELLQKIKDQSQMWMSDSVLTQAEKQVGQQIDFSV